MLPVWCPRWLLAHIPAPARNEQQAEAHLRLTRPRKAVCWGRAHRGGMLGARLVLCSQGLAQPPALSVSSTPYGYVFTILNTVTFPS